MSRSIDADTGREAADRARGTTDYSDLQHICEATTVSMQDAVLSVLNATVLLFDYNLCLQNISKLTKAQNKRAVFPIQKKECVCLHAHIT